jgi:hypothetical protein
MATETEIKRFDIASVAKMVGVLGGVQGILVGIPFFFLGSLLGGGRGISFLLFIVLGGFIFGAISGAITAGIYNLLSGMVGGVRVHLNRA